jgi:Carboxypeptidase regulatory-like domain
MSHNRYRLRMICVLLGAAAAFIGPEQVQAQILYGSIVGKITDQSGAAVPGATVTITNKGTNQSRESLVDSVGGYDFPNVIPGTYAIRVTATGFTTFVKTDVLVTINNVTRVDVGLQLGAMAETVTVVAEASFNLAREGIDERQFRFGLRIGW